MHVWKRGGWAVMLTLALAGCRESTPVESLPGVRQALDAAGMRLAGIKSERELTALVTREAALLDLLTPEEREALGRNALRFRAPAPVIVAVAAPPDAAPFWLGDQGFRTTGETIQVDGRPWPIHRRRFPAGWIGLGVNGLDRSSDEHYVAFVRPGPGMPVTPEQLELRPDPDASWLAGAAREGVSAASDVHRPITDLPPALDGSILLQPARDRRHMAAMATGRVWKTHSPSSERPDQTLISLGADPARQLVFSWRTTPWATGSVVRIAPARYLTPEEGPVSPDDLAGLREVHGSAELVRSPGLLNDPVILRHMVAVDGLEPDTTYYYALGDGTPRRWGPWRTVKTASARPKRLEFLYLGDAQTGLEGWGSLLSSAFRRHPGMDAILMAGDLVDRGNERTNWDHFLLRAAPVFDRVPVMPAAGNHEYLDRGPRLYQSTFRLPADGPEGVGPGLVYSFRYGEAFFAVLDSTSAVMSDEEAARQAEWLDRTLASSREDWKFVMFHHPIYPSHPVRDNARIREHWVPVFDRHHVDMVLQGHDHAYLRTPPMKAHQRVSSPAEGTTYVVAVSGDKFVPDQPSRDYIEVGRTGVSTYQTIEIDEAARRLTYRSWSSDGEVLDALVIRKPGDEAGSTLAELPGDDAAERR
jgi:hypothetical protein